MTPPQTLPTGQASHSGFQWGFAQPAAVEEVAQMANMRLKMARMRPKMAKMRPKMARMRPKMAKMRFKIAKMRLKIAKMRPKIAKIRLKMAKMSPNQFVTSWKKQGLIFQLATRKEDPKKHAK